MNSRVIKSFILLLVLSSFLFGQTQKVKSIDGVEIAFTVQGEGEPALVFIHGWSCDKSFWADQVKELSSKYKVVAIDLGGHGESGLNRENWTMEKYGEDVASVVNALKLNKIILIGHSMGGSVIIEAAKLLKGKVLGLIGADTFQSFKDDWSTEQKEAFLNSFKTNFVATAKGFVKGMFPASADTSLVKRVVEKMSQAPPQVAVSAMRNLFYYDPLPILKQTDLPIISINCDMYPVSIEENKKYVKSFEVKLMKGVGHFVMLENPKEFNSYLYDAINELTQ